MTHVWCDVFDATLTCDIIFKQLSKKVLFFYEIYPIDKGSKCFCIMTQIVMCKESKFHPIKQSIQQLYKSMHFKTNFEYILCSRFKFYFVLYTDNKNAHSL